MGRAACTAVATKDTFTCSLTASKLRQPHMLRLNKENAKMNKPRNSIRRRGPVDGLISGNRSGFFDGPDVLAAFRPNAFTISPQFVSANVHRKFGASPAELLDYG